jgi:peptide/nickel transport system substrate-binding protein
MGETRSHTGGITRRQFLGRTAAAGVAASWLIPGLAPLAQAAGEKRGGTLNMGVSTDIFALDPNEINFANNPVFFQVYNYLVKFSTTLRPEPDLAANWELAKDGTSAIFRLREGVRTHSGGVFDAEALIANFKRIKDKATGGGIFSRLQDWTSAEKLDATTVRFRFSRPHPDYLAMVARWGMIDPAAFATVRQKGGGTGPFKVLEWIPGDHLTFVRFDQYWQPGIPLLDRIVVRPFTDPQAMENAFRGGTIDIAHTIPNKDAARLRAAGLQLIPTPVANEYFILTLNTQRPPFDNPKVRQAFLYLVDRESIVKTVLGGVGGPSVQPVAPGSPGYDPELNARYAFNPAKAKELLASAGFGKGFKTGILVSTNSAEPPEIAEMIQADLKKAGIEAPVNRTDASSYYPQYFGGNFDINISFLTLATLDPTDFTISSAYRLDATNPSWMKVGPPPAYVEAIRKLTATFDEPERWASLRVAVRYILDQAWAIPIALRVPTFGVDKAVKGFAVDPQMIVDLRGIWLDR